MNEFKLCGNEKFKTITNEETIKLFKENSKSAKDKIFTGNMALISHVIHKYFYNYKNEEDLFQYGAIGLWKSILNFDVSKDFEFSTYAVPMILGEIKRYIRDYNNSVRITRGVSVLSKKINTLQDVYMLNSNNKKLNVDEISKLLMVSKNRISDVIISGYDVVSLDDYISCLDSNEKTLGDIVSNPIDNFVEEFEVKDIIMDTLKKLSKKEKDVICFYYGIEKEKKTQDEIASIVGLSQPHVSRIISKFMNNLKNDLDFQNQEKIISLKEDKKINFRQTIYEKISNYKPRIIDEELEKLDEEKKFKLLSVYPKKIKNIKDKFDLNDKTKANYILEELIYNLALRCVSNPEEKINEYIYVEKKQYNEEGMVKMDNKLVHINIDKLVKCFNKTEDEILKALELLKPINKKIMELRYGLNNNPVTEIKEIAKIVSLEEKQVISAIGNSKTRMKELMGDKPKYKLDKTDKYNDKNIIIDKLLKDFPNYTKEQIINAANKLSERKKEIFILYYGLDGNAPMRNCEIMKKLNLTNQNVSVQINLARTRVKEILENKKEDSVSSNIKNEEVDISRLNIQENEDNQNYKKVFSFDQVINFIKSGKYDGKDKFFLCDNLKISIKTMLGDCTLAPINVRFLYVDESKAIKKKCHVYEITATNSSGKQVKNYKIVKEQNEKKFYPVINKDKHGLWNFDNLTNDCGIVCSTIANEEIIDLFEDDKSNEKKKMSLSEYMQRLYEYGVEAFEQKKLVPAESNFATLLGIASSDQIIYNCNVYLGKIYMKRKKFLIAEKYFKDALTISKDYFVLLELGKAQFALKKYKDTLKTLSECNDINYNSIYHKIEEAKVFYQMGEPGMALQKLDDCITYRNDDYSVHLERARILYDMGKYDDALKETDICEQKRPSYSAHQTIMGKINYLKGNYDKAFEIFDKCVEADKQKDVLYSIIAIGYFFHEMGEKELAYHYYNETYMFPAWTKLTDEEVKEHISKHNSNKQNEKMHSVLNADISFDEIKKLIKGMEKTGTKELYDVYQIYWPNIGYMQVDEKTKIIEDYLTIFTLPFTNKIMMCYPDFKFDGKIINEPVSIDVLKSKIDSQCFEQTKKDTVQVYKDSDLLDNSSKKDNSKKLINIDKLVKCFNKTEDEILKALELLKPINKKIMELRYGLNNNPVTEIKEIAKIVSLEEKQVIFAIRNSKTRMKELMGDKPKYKLDKTEKYNNKNITIDKLLKDFPNYTKEQIINAANKLSERKKEIFILYYGLDGNAPMRNYEIMEKLNLTTSNVSRQICLARTQVKEILTKTKKEETSLKYRDKDLDAEIKFIPKEFSISSLENFEQNKENFRVLINLLSNPTQQVILLLSLGYVEDKCYAPKEISNLLGISKEKVIEIINDGLSNIIGFSSMTINGVESARKQLRKQI